MKLIAGLAMSFMVVSCSGKMGMSLKTVGARTFEVPDKYVVKHDFSFLPKSQNDGLTFVLNPDAERQKQLVVGVDSAEDVCNRSGKPAVDMVPRACAAARGEVGVAPPGKLRKQLRFPDDDTQWDYHAENGGVVAMCTTGKDDGSCDATFAWKDLIVSISFGESDIGRLEALQREVDELLQSWSRAER
jgi:hypothetical protein